MKETNKNENVKSDPTIVVLPENERYYNIAGELLPRPESRVTVWEARQMILAEVHEYLEAREKLSKDSKNVDLIMRAQSEALDVMGYLNYLGTPLFQKACYSICKRNIYLGMAVYSAFRTVIFEKPPINKKRDQRNYDHLNERKRVIRSMFKRWARKNDDFRILKDQFDKQAAFSNLVR